MKPLSSIIRKNGLTYILVRAGNRTFIYKQRGPGNHASYEVFRRKVKARHRVQGKIIPASLMFPYNEAFGKWAWAYFTLAKALKKFGEIEDSPKGAASS